MTTLDDYAVMILRETFGGAFCPYRFTDTISEPATDLGNDLLSCKDWNENEVFSPHVESLEPPLLFDHSVSFVPARTPDAVVPH